MPSPFEGLLHSNYAPSEQECTLIKEHLVERQRELATLQAELKRTSFGGDSSPSELPERLDGLLASIDAHRALLSPIRWLPNEILREIFIRTLPSSHNASLSPRESPLLLMQISPRWRYIAASTPRLWSTIHIPLPLPSTSHSLIENWITRAGALPLLASFSSIKDPSESTLPDLKSAYKRLGPARNRLRSLEVTLRADSEEEIAKFTVELPQSGPNPFARVSRAVLHILVGDSSFMDGAPLIFESLGLHQNSDLRELEMTCNFHILTLSECFLHSTPWKNLTKLDLQTRNINRAFKGIIRNGALLNILSRSPNLVSLKAFAAGSLTENDMQDLQDLVLNNKLRHVSLALFNFSQLSTVELLARCDWPVLASLHLWSQWSRDGETEKSYVLEKVISKFGNALTSLRFSYRALPPDHLTQFLALLPNLVQIHIDNGTMRRWHNLVKGGDTEDDDSDQELEDDPDVEKSDEVLASLTPTARTKWHCSCPHLQYLRWEGHTPFSDTAVKELLLARASITISPVRLKQVVIKFHRGMEEDILVDCAQLLEGGLKLRLVYSPRPSGSAGTANAYRDLYVEGDPLTLGWEEDAG
ncbi:hypothetical protein FA13DRAFT_1784166 [Coprinellus micaceus]|uniref:Uncharacterized protein n=1 Tax=Coprinellus micaceus TaxID=71717 RepID=A0A4Y7U0T8_COPMI|nr:hypothetical protein FA13DRAFT_1784166 [Coprinellus micaceus]